MGERIVLTGGDVGLGEGVMNDGGVGNDGETI